MSDDDPRAVARDPYREVDPPLPVMRLRAVGRSRLGSCFGGVLLACTLFMPALRACENSVTIPSHELAKELSRPSFPSLTGLAGVLALYLVPYLFGALAALAAIGRYFHARWATKLAWGALVTGGFGLAVLILAVAGAGGKALSWDVPIAIVGVYFCSSFGLRRSAPLRATMVCAFACVAWFGFWSAIGGLYGVQLAFLGSLVLLLSSLAEGRVLLGRRLFW